MYLYRSFDPIVRLSWAIKNTKSPWDDELYQAVEFVKAYDREREAIPIAIELLKAGNPIVRARAVEVLGRVDAAADTVVPEIIKALEDQDEEVRRHAVEALGRVKPIQGRAVAAFVKARNDESLHVKRAVVEVLATMDLGPAGEPAVPMLVAALEDDTVAFFAITALGNIGPKAEEAVPVLEGKIGEMSDYERCFIAESLWKIEGNADKVVPILAGLLESKCLLSRKEAALVLGEIGPPAQAAIPALVKAIEFEPAVEDTPTTNREPSTDVSFPTTREMPDHEFYPQVRDAAAKALMKINPREARKILGSRKL